MKNIPMKHKKLNLKKKNPHLWNYSYVQPKSTQLQQTKPAMVSQRIKTALTENHLQLLTFSASSSLHRGLKNVQASCILLKDIFPKKDLGSWESTECIRTKNTAESPYRKEILKKDSLLCNT